MSDPTACHVPAEDGRRNMYSPRLAKCGRREPKIPTELRGRQFGGVLISGDEGRFICTCRDFPGALGEAGRKATAQKELAKVICDLVKHAEYQVPVKPVGDSVHQAWAEKWMEDFRKDTSGSEPSFELIRIKF